MHIYQKTKICGWGNYPCIEADILDNIDFSKSFIPRAYGKSYGDEAIYYNVYNTTNLDFFIDIDFEKGLLQTQSGIVLDKIIRFLLPRGYTLPIVPGTALISVGGAISNDIHGKSSRGSFGDFVEEFEIITPSGVYQCSKDKNSELFYGAIGGMGLFGIITKAKLKIIQGSPYIKQFVVKTNTIHNAIEYLKAYDKDFEFSVAWVDAFTEKSVVMFGDYADYEELPIDLKMNFNVFNKKPNLEVPIVMPNFLINDLDMRLYNIKYYNSIKEGHSYIDYFSYFFPLDNIKNWNRLYGKRGFLQYQFVAKEDSIYKVFDIIKSYKIYPYLVVLKRLKSAENRIFSFVKEGFTLALDFPVNKRVLNMLNKFDEIVKEYNGLIYMAKDARLSRDVFWDIYKEQAKNLMSLKAKYDKEFKLRSVMFERLFMR